MITVPWRLVRRDDSDSIQGYFLPERSTVVLARLACRFPSWPTIHALATGFLVLPSQSVGPIPGTIALRKLAGDFYLPAEAELVPALLPDELVALTRDRGLLALPGGRIEAFDPSQVLAEPQVLTFGPVRRPSWQSWPVSHPPTTPLHTIRVETPPDETVAILEVGKPTEPPENPDTTNEPHPSWKEVLTARGLLRTGQLLNWLGRAAGLKGLAKAGAKYVASALQAVPALSQKVFDQQEAALRELLRQFEQGNIEAALRKAPVAVADPNARPAAFGTSGRLTPRNITYRLQDLLASGSGGVAWLGGGNVWHLLAEKYRQLAEAAFRQGDVRRAAYIYGVLLRDPRQAARVLDAGGFHRDAAILYRDKLNDPLAAARSFAQAACWDEAIRLYLQQKKYLEAADIYRQLGEEALARQHYQKAVDERANSGDFLGAGDLVLDKLLDVEQAEHYWKIVWSLRGHYTLEAGRRLLKLESLRTNWPGIREWLQQGINHYPPPQHRNAAQLVRILQSQSSNYPPAVREELLDRCRLFLAEHLQEYARTHSRPGTIITETFGLSDWPAALLRDAREALRRACQPTPTAIPADVTEKVQWLDDELTAACLVSGGRELLLASVSGQVVLMRANRAGPKRFTNLPTSWPVQMAFAEQSRQMVLMYDPQRYSNLLWIQLNSKDEVSAEAAGPPVLPETYLQPEIEEDGQCVRLRTFGSHFDCDYIGSELSCANTQPVQRAPGTPIFLAANANQGHWLWAGKTLFLRVLPRQPADPCHPLGEVQIPWLPVVPVGSLFQVPPVSYLMPAVQVIELVGVNADHAVYWSEVRRGAVGLEQQTASASTETGYNVACLVGPGLIAAVNGKNQLDWLRVDGQTRLKKWSTTRQLHTVGIPVFMARLVGESSVIVLHSDGWATRVPLP